MTVSLLVMVILPVVAALMLLAGRQVVGQQAARQFALVASVATLAASLWLAYQFVQLPVPAGPRDSPVEPRYSVAYHWFNYGSGAATELAGAPLHFDLLLGVDGISLALIVLTTVLTVSWVLISWEWIRERAAG